VTGIETGIVTGAQIAAPDSTAVRVALWRDRAARLTAEHGARADDLRTSPGEELLVATT
jgi:hypothetical protein